MQKNSTDIYAEVSQTFGQIEQLNAETKAISASVSTIRGIAVVADEVRNLASRTSSFAVEIHRVVERNMALTQNLKDKMKNASEFSAEGLNLVEQAYDSQEQIETLANSVSQTIANLTPAAA